MHEHEFGDIVTIDCGSLQYTINRSDNHWLETSNKNRSIDGKQISCDGTGSMQEYDIFRFSMNVVYVESQRIIYNHMVDEYQYIHQQVLPLQLLHND